MYQGVGELMPTKDCAISIRNITEKDQHELQKLVLNMRKKKKKLVAIHKANVLGLVMDCF